MESAVIPLPPELSKFAAASALAKACRVEIDAHDGPSVRNFIEGLIKQGRGVSNGDLVRRARPDLGGGVESIAHAAAVIRRSPPVFLNGAPPCFAPMAPGEPWPEAVPAASTLTIEDGWFAMLSDAPTVFAADGSLIRPFSSGYNGLACFYDRPLAALLDGARRIDGTTVVLIDDVFELNYCHWLVDWLPRLALAPDAPDLHVLVAPGVSDWQRECLTSCGVGADRIVPVDRWQAVRARRLVVPSHLTDSQHPGFKGSPWVIDFLRSRLGPSDPVLPRRRLLISREDARWRRILNEDALAARLRPCGFERVTLSGLSVRRQAELFGEAEAIVSLNGAGLANIVFSTPRTKLLALFPRTRCSPAFWVLAAAAGASYATYVVDDVRRAEHPSFDDVTVDVEHFAACCLPWLTGAVGVEMRQ